jgi:uncharacterized membrane protein
MKTTILGGVLFLAPLAILAIILGKAFQISIVVAEPISKFITLDNYIGVLAVNVMAIFLIVVFCYLAGLVAKHFVSSDRVQRLEGFLVDLVPGYAVFRTIISNASTENSVEMLMKPVLVRFDDYEQIAFEVEKSEDYSVLFLPGTPAAWSGSSSIVAAERITYLNMSTMKAVKLMRVFGQGSLDARKEAFATKETSR